MAAEPLPPGARPGQAPGTSAETAARATRWAGGAAGADGWGRRLERGGHGRRPRALVRGAREKRPPRPASLRRPGFLHRQRPARLAPRAATEDPLSPALSGESTSTGASPQRAAADGSPRPAHPLLAAA